jgi:hypothetical protein
MTANEKKTAVITGASSGIGRACVCRLLKLPFVSGHDGAELCWHSGIPSPASPSASTDRSPPVPMRYAAVRVASRPDEIIRLHGLSHMGTFTASTRMPSCTLPHCWQQFNSDAPSRVPHISNG